MQKGSHMKLQTMCILVVAFLLVGYLTTAVAQTEMQTFHLKDGSTTKGRIIAQDDSTIVIETIYGTFDIQRNNLLKVEQSGVNDWRSLKDTRTIYMNDGSIFKGTVTSDSGGILQIETAHGIVRLPRTRVDQASGSDAMGTRQTVLILQIRTGNISL
jgi:hypothetical protein